MAIHPLFKKKRRRAQVVGYAAIATGILGFVLPFMPGLVLCVAGLSLLSFNSPKVRLFIARIHVTYPHIGKLFVLTEERLVDFFDLRTHTYERVQIPVRNNHSLCAILERSVVPNSPVAVLLHAGSGTKDTPATVAMAEGLRARGYTVVRFDAYDGLGESGGAYPSFTASRYYEDLSDAIHWIQGQAWSSKRLILSGHSVGGLVVLRYAAQHSNKVDRVLLFAPTLSGSALEEAYRTRDPDMLNEWRALGVRPVEHPLTGETHMLDLSFLEDLKRFDCNQWVARFTMPIEVFCGDRDTLTDAETCRRFASAVGDSAYVTILTDLEHMPTQHTALHILIRAIVAA